METTNLPSKRAILAGRILGALPLVVMLASAAAKLTSQPMVIDAFTKQFGYQTSAILPIGVIELLCVLLCAIPRTSVLGAILITGYLGGAVATHVRVGDPWFMPFILGVVVWGGLFLRDARIRALIPLMND